MRRLKIFERISLDGVIEVRGAGEDGEYPTATGQHPIAPPLAEISSSQRMARSSICCLAGAPTISGRRVWPKAPSSPLSSGINAATKYIATHRPDSLEWGQFEGLKARHTARTTTKGQ